MVRTFPTLLIPISHLHKYFRGPQVTVRAFKPILRSHDLTRILLDDPWRRATPHSPTALPRPDTVQRPFKLISDGVHHWDENGLANRTSEPPTIKLIHAQEVAFVKAWLGL